MKRTFTFWLTLIAIGLCALNLLDHDSGNAMLYNFSIPVWIIASFDSLHLVSKAVIYILTVLQFFLIGYAIDAYRTKIRERTGRAS